MEDSIVWGCAAIARVIKRSERATYHLLETGQLPAKKISGKWCGSPKRMLAHLAGEDEAAKAETGEVAS